MVNSITLSYTISSAIKKRKIEACEFAVASFFIDQVNPLVGTLEHRYRSVILERLDVASFSRFNHKQLELLWKKLLVQHHLR